MEHGGDPNRAFPYPINHPISGHYDFSITKGRELGQHSPALGMGREAFRGRQYPLNL